MLGRKFTVKESSDNKTVDTENLCRPTFYHKENSPGIDKGID